MAEHALIAAVRKLRQAKHINSRQALLRLSQEWKSYRKKGGERGGEKGKRGERMSCRNWTPWVFFVFFKGGNNLLSICQGVVLDGIWGVVAFRIKMQYVKFSKKEIIKIK